jgi:hypothetical protein
MQASREILEAIFDYLLRGDAEFAIRHVIHLIDDVDVLNIQFNKGSEAYLQELTSLKKLCQEQIEVNIFK